MEVGAGARLSPAMSYDLEEVEEDPITEAWYFPGMLGCFCLFRLLRPLFLRGFYKDSEMWGDGGAVFADACLFAAVMSGLVSAVLLSAPCRYYLVSYCSEEVLWYHEPLALGLLAGAVVMDVLHHLLAVIRYPYYWTPALTEGTDTAESLAYVMIALHVLGFLATFWGLIRFFARFRAAMSEASGRSLGDVKKGKVLRRYLAWTGGELAPEPLPRQQPRARNDDGSRAGAGDHQGGEPSAHAGPRGGTGGADAPGSRAGGTGRSRPPSYPSEPPHVWQHDSQMQPPDTPLTAWFWSDDKKWLEVKVIRTTGNDMVSVRLGGGIVVQVNRSQLRPRYPGEKMPRKPPEGLSPRWGEKQKRRPSADPGDAPRADAGTAGGSERQGSTASEDGPWGRQQRSPDPPGRNASSASSGPPPPRTGAGASATGPAAGAREPPPPPSFCDPPQAAAPAEQDDSEGARWAASRMEQLRKELCELDRRTPEEKKKRLRGLQRELHPDKQPEEFRAYAQPLFLLVQREWEITAASNNAGADS